MDIQPTVSVTFSPLSTHWVPLLWPLIEADLSVLPKSWPRSLDELTGWALGTYRQQTIADRSIILARDHEDGDYHPVGIITGDLVKGSTIDNFPGARYGDVNIAYMIFSAYAGKGYATRSVIDVAHAWKEDGKNPVLRIVSDNTASHKVAQRAGFSRVDEFNDEGRVLFIYRSL